MEFHDLFQHFWWLIFPVLSMIWGMVDLAARHRRAREGMALIKSYIDQGKEPPPELLKLLDVKDSVYGNRGASRSAWPGVFLFAALCAGFLMFAHWPGGLDFEPRQIAALHFVALIMGGLCLGCLVMTLRSERDRNPRP
jgi:hypothetical protein